MTKISSNPNCVNSPKKEFIKQLNIAFAQGNVQFLTESVADEIVWNIIGDRKIEGEEEAASGIMKMQIGKKHAFSNFYVFQGAKGIKIKSITLYVIGV